MNFELETLAKHYNAILLCLVSITTLIINFISIKTIILIIITISLYALTIVVGINAFNYVKLYDEQPFLKKEIDDLIQIKYPNLLQNNNEDIKTFDDRRLLRKQEIMIEKSLLYKLSFHMNKGNLLVVIFFILSLMSIGFDLKEFNMTIKNNTKEQIRSFVPPSPKVIPNIKQNEDIKEIKKETSTKEDKNNSK